MRLRGKILPIALAAMMTLGQVPATAYAAEDTVGDGGEQIEVQVDEEASEETTEEVSDEVSEETTGEVDDEETEEAAEEVAEEVTEETTEAAPEETEGTSEGTTEPVSEEEKTESAVAVEISGEQNAVAIENDTEEAKKEAEKRIAEKKVAEAKEAEKKADEEFVKEAEIKTDAEAEEAAAATTYSVTYVNGKTNPSNPTSYKKSANNIMLSDPTWKGYTFKGWYYDAEFTRRATMIKANTTGDKTFYAKWEANKYKVSFDGNGATSGTMKDMTCAYANTYSLRTNKFSRKGYDFTGWNTKANGSGKAYVDEDEIKNLNSNAGAVVTLYAQWKAHSYKVEFKGYRAESGSMSTLSCKYGKSYTLPANAFKKRGYTFVGWNTKTDGSGRSFKDGESVKNLTAVDGNTLTLYTQWEKTQYKIVYGLGGGTNNAKNPASYNITTNTITLQAASRTGYTFGGWYTDKTYTTKVTTIPKGSVGKKSLYAKWDLIRYNITYNFNGGNATGSCPTSYYISSDNIVLSAPIRTGYKFGGWYKNSDFSGARVDVISKGSYGNVTLYAKWIPITYTVVFNGNGADSGSMGSMTCTYGQKYNFPANNFVKSGKKFWGWSLEAPDGSDCINNVYNLTATDGAVITLYAQWASAVNIVRTETYPMYKYYVLSDGTIVTCMAIHSITYDYKQNSNGTYDVTLHVKYEKVYNEEGYSTTYAVAARYYIFDQSENMIKSGSIIRSGLKVGNTYTDDITLYGVNEGDIYIDFEHYK